MGMFDRVVGKCPHCNNDVELQSKAGDCDLSDYSMNNVPLAIAEDLSYNYSEFNTTCENCGGRFLFVTDPPLPKEIRCKLVKAETPLLNVCLEDE